MGFRQQNSLKFCRKFPDFLVRFSDCQVSLSNSSTFPGFPGQWQPCNFGILRTMTLDKLHITLGFGIQSMMHIHICTKSTQQASQSPSLTVRMSTYNTQKCRSIIFIVLHSSEFFKIRKYQKAKRKA